MRVEKNDISKIKSPNVHLQLLKPKFPTYPLVNFQIRGYDFPVVEKYQRFLHNMAESMDMDVVEGCVIRYFTVLQFNANDSIWN